MKLLFVVVGVNPIALPIEIGAQNTVQELKDVIKTKTADLIAGSFTLHLARKDNAWLNEKDVAGLERAYVAANFLIVT